MKDLVRNNQMAFIKGRRIHELQIGAVGMPLAER